MRIFVGTFELKLRSYDIEVACQLPSSLVDFNSVLFTFAPNMALHFVIRHRTRVPISCLIWFKDYSQWCQTACLLRVVVSCANFLLCEKRS